MKYSEKLQVVMLYPGEEISGGEVFLSLPNGHTESAFDIISNVEKFRENRNK